MAELHRMPPTTSGGECVFCAIGTGQAPAAFVHEDDEFAAVVDLRPVTTGHLLVLPRAHHADLASLPAEAGARMFTIAHTLAAALRRTDLRCEGINLFLADGKAAGQEIPHVHLHVIPRFAGDGFVMDADWRVRSREELAEVAAKVKAAL
ncbi:HIT family protein [Amycolatopsis balhimycina DSM 5908]|uniref:HIT family protein n=1 Tax=Amycolatopsis balhimycina DSM 5908 TaxID=1081091 RepID=A0A428WNL4_AMYBA|nr:HIT family protein [Amycolatopsis balhimycina]RSM44661.1 HIT family protein [Amycolatopsis balhimycina DSM 5908]